MIRESKRDVLMGAHRESIWPESHCVAKQHRSSPWNGVVRVICGRRGQRSGNASCMLNSGSASGQATAALKSVNVKLVTQAGR